MRVFFYFLKRLLYKKRRSLSKYFTRKHKLNTFGVSETSKCRERLSLYCRGNGLDLGFGGDPITLSAIRMDFPSPYANVGPYPVQLAGTAENLIWFKDNVLDYIYSSHLLEDFYNTEAVLREWLRVLKPGGLLIIYCPDEQRFRKHCKDTGQPYNPAHVHDFFSLGYVKQILSEINQTKVVHEKDFVDIYSWELVCEKL